MLNLKEVKKTSLFGECIIRTGDTPECRQMIIDQMQDNYTMVVSIIGYNNARFLAASLVDFINGIAKKYIVK